jgi:glycosyltransferase involved in cell wall biosynthesis
VWVNFNTPHLLKGERNKPMDGRNAGREGALTSLIFPTYNAGRLIERTWNEVKGFLRSATGNWEVLFICDGCTDNTAERLAQLTRGDSNRVRIVSYSPNRGKGYALRQGLAVSRGEWRIFTDVDLAYSFDDVLRVAQALHNGSHVAIASRCHPESRILVPISLQGYAYRRHLQSLTFSFITRAFLPLGQRDTQAGLKGLSAGVVRMILPHLSCDGFGFDCELLAACAYYGLAVKEVPVCVRYEDRSSTTGLGAIARMLKELWRIRRTWRQMTIPQPQYTSPRQAA